MIPERRISECHLNEFKTNIAKFKMNVILSNARDLGFCPRSVTFQSKDPGFLTSAREDTKARPHHEVISGEVLYSRRCRSRRL